MSNFLKDEFPPQEEENPLDNDLEDETELEQAEESEDPEVQALAKKLNDLKEQKKKMVKKESSEPTKDEIKDMIMGHLSRSAELMRYL